jgi:hypothetical protein
MSCTKRFWSEGRPEDDPIPQRYRVEIEREDDGRFLAEVVAP